MSRYDYLFDYEPECCPECGSEYHYQDPINWTCADCGYVGLREEWLNWTEEEDSDGEDDV